VVFGSCACGGCEIVVSNSFGWCVLERVAMFVALMVVDILFFVDAFVLFSLVGVLSV